MVLKKLPFILVFTVWLAGCQSDKGNTASSDAAKKQAPRSIVVFGIDDTGSYELWEQAKNIACRIVEQLQPGDTSYCRRITDSSYLDACLILRLQLPLIEDPGNNNPFDRKAKKIKRQQQSRVDTLKKETCTRLSVLRPTNSKRTDIYGFVAAAGDRFTLASLDHKGILILASDLEDNVGYQPKVNLSGVQVAVLGFQSSKDPVKTQRVKQSWTQKFTEAGAKRIVFLPLEEKFSLDQFKGD